jgi:rhamnose transport system ATP-binding protein
MNRWPWGGGYHNDARDETIERGLARRSEVQPVGNAAGVSTTTSEGVRPVVELVNIWRSFGGARAVRGVSLSVRSGQILGLVGENGAGKSTLVKILTGVLEPDRGHILVDGRTQRIANPRTARELGIAATYQEPMVFPDLDVAENVFAGRQPVHQGRIAWGEVYLGAEAVFDELGVSLDPHRPVYQLGIADRQLIEIARSLLSGARVLILDEPTAVLSSREIDTLFALLSSLRARGVALVFISHKLDEVTAITDRVAVLRDGELVAERATSDISVPELIRLMVGRQIDELYPTPPSAGGQVVLEVEHLSRRGYFEDVSFSLRSGEILGLAGLVGAGRTELAEAIFGVQPADSGRMVLDGYPYVARSPRQAIRCGLAYLPENRLANGLVPGMRVPLNITMPVWGKIAGHLGRFRTRIMYRQAADLATRVQLQAARLNQLTSALSGGNQQKVVLGKWLATEPRILILDEPTHGIDVGTKSEVLSIVAKLAQSGVAVIFISSELEEVRAMSSRLLVMRAGRIVAEFSTPVESYRVLEAAAGAAGAVGE